ncbi:MAG: c-type cytochrome [Myxococcaceae bacterium]|nr:c-type cytochrome [Myxococcaceae bacterium]
MSSENPNLRKYDDILEEDNHLPNWWLAILFGTIVFGFGYWIAYHTTDTFKSPPEEYQADVEALKKARAAANPTSEDALVALAANTESVTEGQKVYATTCASCHGPNGEGLVGPNLTDKFWIHGNTGTDILKAVNEGFPDKGMPAWGAVIGDTKARNVTAYVLSIRGKNLPGKEPQGNPVE